MLYLRLNVEDWRERILSRPESASLNEVEINDLSKDLTLNVLSKLSYNDISYRQVVSQSVGAFEIIQPGSDIHEVQVFNAILEEELESLMGAMFNKNKD